jgi:hypothetical protein
MIGLSFTSPGKDNPDGTEYIITVTPPKGNMALGN